MQSTKPKWLLMTRQHALETIVFAVGLAIGVACGGDSTAQAAESSGRSPADTAAVARLLAIVRGALSRLTDRVRQTPGLREVTTELHRLHRAFDRNLAEMQNAAQEQTKTIALLLGSVALISLLVGAIGIANVMLVSVTERTREIGIRMAVGARGRDVLFQFLTEAVVLAVVGGLLGLGLGTGVAKYMAAQAQWPTLLSAPVMFGTMLLAGFAGVVAGFYPALRASRLDPIEALRFE